MAFKSQSAVTGLYILMWRPCYWHLSVGQCLSKDPVVWCVTEWVIKNTQPSAHTFIHPSTNTTKHTARHSAAEKHQSTKQFCLWLCWSGERNVNRSVKTCSADLKITFWRPETTPDNKLSYCRGTTSVTITIHWSKSQTLAYRTCIWRHHWGNPAQISTRSWTTEN